MLSKLPSLFPSRQRATLLVRVSARLRTGDVSLPRSSIDRHEPHDELDEDEMDRRRARRAGARVRLTGGELGAQALVRV
jgi:hypothetical protein